MTKGYWETEDKNVIFSMYNDSFIKDEIGNIARVWGTPVLVEDVPRGFRGKSVKLPNGSALQYRHENFGVKDFTVDFWCKKASAHRFCGGSGSIAYTNTYGFLISDGYNTGLGSGYDLISVVDGSKQYFSINEWHHHALVRKNGIGYYFVDGKRCGIRRSGFNMNLQSKKFCLNSGAGTPEHPKISLTESSGDGYYKALRISDFARWTDNFQPPRDLRKCCLYLYRSNVWGM